MTTINAELAEHAEEKINTEPTEHTEALDAGGLRSRPRTQAKKRGNKTTRDPL